MSGPAPTFSTRTQRKIARAFTNGSTTYELAKDYGVSQFLIWSIIDRHVPESHPRRRVRRRKTDKPLAYSHRERIAR